VEKVEVEALVAQQPFLDRRGLVGREVVEDHVNVERGADVTVDLVQERDKSALV
jgi:hypothetical protein